MIQTIAFHRGEQAWAALAQQGGRWDGLVAVTPDIDRFCSAADWIVPAQQTFGSGELVVALADGAGVALSLTPLRRRVTALCGLDPLWHFACPVVGPDPGRGAALLVEVMDRSAPDWAAVFLTGVVGGSPLATEVTTAVGRRLQVRPGPVMARCVAHLDDGVGSYLARRSPVFRRNARRAQRRAEAAGVEIVLVDGGGAEVVKRAVAVDATTWKGRMGDGLTDRRLALFYGRMAARMEPTGRLRAGFAHLDGQDVGYILGAVGGGTYRGLQLGYDAAHSGLSLGNLLQLAQMEALVAQGVHRYDLGMDMRYKQSWSDEVFTTQTLVLLPR